MIDPVELAWTVIAAVGLLLALDALHQAREDRRFVRRSDRPIYDRRREDGRRRQLELALVDSDVASAWWIVAIETLFLFVGAGAIVDPTRTDQRTPLGWVLICLLIAGAAALPLRLYGQRRRRRQLVRTKQ